MPYGLLGASLIQDHQYADGFRELGRAILLRPWNPLLWLASGLSLLLAFLQWFFQVGARSRR